jgi:AcrR family transcriptional regulator
MGEGTVGLRERKKLKTRGQLADVAIRLFSERGFDATTVEDIVEEVEVSPRTFFRYFDSKEDVVIGFFDTFGEKLREMLAARPVEEPPFTAVRNALGSLADLYADDRRRVLLARQLAYETPAIRARLLDKHARWENGLTQELAARLGVDPELDPEPRLIAAVALAAHSCAVGSWIASEGTADLHALLDRSLETVGAGFDRLTAGPSI